MGKNRIRLTEPALTGLYRQGAFDICEQVSAGCHKGDRGRIIARVYPHYNALVHQGRTAFATALSTPFTNA